MPRIAIIGANGMLGRDVARALAACSPACVDLPELDITSFSQTGEYIRALKPDAVVNCAAYTAVDACEKNADLAFRVNGEGVKNLAIACEKAGADLLHISTDYVFGGEKGAPYIETDQTNPINVYGTSKLYGERALASHTNRFYILRTQWLYGAGGNNFVKTMLRLAGEGRTINVVDDQFGCPTCTKDLAELIARILPTGQYGLYHATNAGCVSWYQFAKDIFRAAGAEADVRPVTTEQYASPTKRPKYSVLDNMALRLAGFGPMRPYAEALEEYMRQSRN